MTTLAERFFAMPVQYQVAWALVVILMIAVFCWSEKADRPRHK